MGFVLLVGVGWLLLVFVPYLVFFRNHEGRTDAAEAAARPMASARARTVKVWHASPQTTGHEWDWPAAAPDEERLRMLFDEVVWVLRVRKLGVQDPQASETKRRLLSAGLNPARFSDTALQPELPDAIAALLRQQPRFSARAQVKLPS